MSEEMKYFAAATEKRPPLARAEHMAKGAVAEGVQCHLGRRRQVELTTYELGEWEEHLVQG
jgi:hypothetical protein